jgi:hypothetical protein
MLSITPGKAGGLPTVLAYRRPTLQGLYSVLSVFLCQNILRVKFSLSELGKTEPLKHMKGYSRRIDDANRLI